VTRPGCDALLVRTARKNGGALTPALPTQWAGALVLTETGVLVGVATPAEGGQSTPFIPADAVGQLLARAEQDWAEAVKWHHHWWGRGLIGAGVAGALKLATTLFPGEGGVISVRIPDGP
jgi:hypothetical protein